MQIKQAQLNCVCKQSDRLVLFSVPMRNKTFDLKPELPNLELIYPLFLKGSGASELRLGMNKFDLILIYTLIIRMNERLSSIPRKISFIYKQRRGLIT